MNDDARRHPIRVVLPRPDHLRKPDTGGGPPKVFGDVTHEVRKRLNDELNLVEEHFARSFKRFPNAPAVAKVVLKEEAIAKSHRPTELFNDETCPVIGVADLGILLVSVTRDGLKEARRLVESRDTKRFVANLSTISTIAPYGRADIIEQEEQYEALSRSVSKEPLKLRLFNHGNDRANSELLQYCLDVLDANDFSIIEPVYYASGLRTFRINIQNDEQLDRLVNYVGTQSLDVFPYFVSVEAQGRTIRDANELDIREPVGSYPVVGLVDSGVSASPLLAPWINTRTNYVPVADRDENHGTFVAGLLVAARHLNHDDPRFPDLPCKIDDICALPRKGQAGLSDDALLALLEDSFKANPDVRVWNMSLGTNRKINARTFSDFAAGLDELQQKYDRLVVLAAGNHEAAMLRPWPANGYGGDELCLPADSVCSIVVASVAHQALSNSAAQVEMPSPFSRKGPGPVYIPKPDLAHYGGNCTITGDFTQVGILSIDPLEKIGERIGTSYAAPMVTQLAAYVNDELKRRPSANLLRALLIHSAALRCGEFDAELMRYRGFGTPGSLADILSCSNSRATLIFEPKLYTGLQYEIRNFPIPQCLLNDAGGLTGIVTMTLVYNPPLDADNKSEYVQTNVDVSLGTYALNKEGKMVQHSEVHKQPEDVGALYERELLEHGYKWSPVKVYRRAFARGAGAGKEWRLMLHCYHRAGFSSVNPQDVALIVTLEDPTGTLPVYSSVMQRLSQISLVNSELEVRGRIRIST